MKVYSEEQQGDTSESRLNNAKSVNDKKKTACNRCAAA